MTRGMTILLVLMASSILSGLACAASSHAYAVINRTDKVIDDVRLTVAEERAGLGTLAPDVSGTFIVDADVPRELILEWTAKEDPHHVTVDLQRVAKDFRGTIVLEVTRDGSVKMTMEEAIEREGDAPKRH